jgi:16S rRNA (guanine527-N7)-methyltransferase
VVAARHLDVRVLPDLFFYDMEKTPAELEIVLQYFADFSPVQLQQFAALQDLYTEWNAKINVISRKDISSLYERHILHSLAIAAAFEFTPGMDIIDIGTGGGFPGIPLAIFFPETRFHLVDSIGKKIKVVEAVAEAAGLTNVTTQHGRAEEIKGRKFDVAVSRAVAPLETLWTWARPLLRKPKARTIPETLTPETPPPHPASSASKAATSPQKSPPAASAPGSWRFTISSPSIPSAKNTCSKCLFSLPRAKKPAPCAKNYHKMVFFCRLSTGPLSYDYLCLHCR